MNNAIILAAGLGTRLKQDVPKPLIKILFKPMISYVLDSLNDNELNKICVLNSNHNEVLNELSGDIIKVYQKNINGSAGAVNAAIDYISSSGYSIILPCDIPLITNAIISNMIDYHIKSNNDITILTSVLENPIGYGRIIRNKNRVIDIVEENELKKDLFINEVNAGILIINNDVLLENIHKINNDNNKREYYITDIVKICSDNYKIDTYHVDDFIGVNNLIDLYKCQNIIRERVIKYHLNNGVKIGNNVSISPNVIINDNVTLEDNVCIYGDSIICSNTVLDNAYILNSNIGKNNYIINSTIIDSIVKDNCKIGPYSHIKQNSIIDNFVRIGNFVEIKDSTIGYNSKVSHLTYVGDSSIGNNVNFGCGSVVSNYDGKKKHKTIIGNDVFIGCNTNIIAPIKIGNSCYIAAGSTVIKDLDDYDFYISRPKEAIKTNYAKRYLDRNEK